MPADPPAADAPAPGLPPLYAVARPDGSWLRWPDSPRPAAFASEGAARYYAEPDARLSVVELVPASRVAEAVAAERSRIVAAIEAEAERLKAERQPEPGASRIVIRQADLEAFAHIDGLREAARIAGEAARAEGERGSEV